jgi:hypothetical protein
MGMRAFNEDTAWAAARQDVRYTAAALDASEAHGKQAEAARVLLAKWDEAERLRQAAEDAVVAANALVALRDVQLDELVGRLAQKLRGEHGRDDAPAFRRYFPEPPNEVIRLGLESELSRIRGFFTVAAEHAPSAEVAAILKGLQELEARGRQALAQREQAATERARASLRVQSWKDEANAVRRSLANQLEAYAIERGLSADYAERFFAPTARRGGKKKPAPPSEPAF